jgi:hypothetical protein
VLVLQLSYLKQSQQSGCLTTLLLLACFVVCVFIQQCALAIIAVSVAGYSAMVVQRAGA